MAYDRYVTEFSDNENRTYGVMDAEAREELSDVKSAIKDISQTTRNLFDDSVLASAGLILGEDGFWYGKVSAWVSAFSSVFPIDGEYESNKRYTVSGTAYFSDVGTYTGGSHSIKVTYTDTTTGTLGTFFADFTTGTDFVLTTTASKSVDHLFMALADGRANNYIWHVKNIQIEEGINAGDFVPHITAHDRVAEKEIVDIKTELSNLTDIVDTCEENVEACFEKISAVEDGHVYNHITLTSSDMRQGGWNDNGTASTSTDRICTKTGYYVEAGEEISYSFNANHRGAVKIYPKQLGNTDNTRTSDSGWKTGTGTYTTPSAGYAVVIVQYNNSTLDPSGYDETISFAYYTEPDWMASIDNNADEIEKAKTNFASEISLLRSDYNTGINTDKIDLVASAFRQGGWNDDGTINSLTDRISTSVGYPITSGTVVSYSMATGHRLGYKIFAKQVGTNQNQIEASTSWMTGQSSFSVNHDGYIVIIVQVSSGTIAVSDYNEKIQFPSVTIPGWIETVQKNVEDSNNLLFPSQIVNPDYKLIKLPEISAWNTGFQNFFELGNEIWFCSESATFGGDSGYGSIYRVNKSDYSYIGKYSHNLGHMAQLDYDKEADRIMLCNTESYDTPKIYVFHNVSTWPDIITASGNNILNLADLTYDTIDLSELRTAHIGGGKYMQYVIACWAERQPDGNRLVIGEGAHGAQWFKIMLGMGENDLGEGTYVPTDADRYNGSYKTLWYKDCPIYDVPDRDTPQGNQGLILYKGKFYEGLGHEPCYGGIYTPLTSDYVRRDLFNLQFFNSDGTVFGGIGGVCVCEGTNIINGQLCLGLAGGYQHLYLIMMHV